MPTKKSPPKRIKVNKNQYHRLLDLTKAPITAQKSSTLAQQYYRLAKRGLVTTQEIHGGYVTFYLNVPDGKIEEIMPTEKPSSNLGKGRPRFNDGRKSYTIRVRLSPDEKKLWDALSDEEKHKRITSEEKASRSQA